MRSGTDIIDFPPINDSFAVIKFTGYIPHLGHFVWYWWFTKYSVSSHLK